MTNKEKLAELTLKEATDFNSELVNKSIQTFVNGLTAMQAKQFLDLDGFVEEYDIPIWEEYKKIIADHTDKDPVFLERFEFYDRAKKAYAIVATGESALYANIILKKGVVK